MRNALLAAAVLVPALAWADDQPYVLLNGRAVAAPAAARAAPAASNQPVATTNQADAMGASTVRAAVVAAQAAGAPIPASPSGQAITGGGGRSRRGVTRGSAVQRRASSRRGAGSADAPPPYYDKPGALIRTEGQLPVYSDPGNARTHSVESGGFVDIDQRKAHDSGRSPGVHWSPPDTRPPVNPTSGAGGNAVTANGPAVTPNSAGSGGGTGNNGDGLGNGAGSGPGNNGGARQPDSANAPLSGTGFDGSF